MAINKKRKYHSAFVLTNMAKIGFFGGTLNKMDFVERKERIKKIKYHMDEFRELTRIFKTYTQNATYNEEMSRHFSLIRDEIKGLEESLDTIAEKTLRILETKNILTFNEPENLKGNTYTPTMKRDRFKLIRTLLVKKYI